MKNNKNKTVQWIITKNNNSVNNLNKFIIPQEIFDTSAPIRGIYGIFIVDLDNNEECAYVGRTDNMYLRFLNPTVIWSN